MTDKAKKGKRPVAKKAWDRRKPQAAPPVVVDTPVTPEVAITKVPEEVHELIKLLTDAFSGRNVDMEKVKAAVLDVLDGYDIKIHTFLIAVARAKFARVDRTLRFVDKVEERLFTEAKLATATTFELLQMHRIAQSSLLDSLAYIERTLKLREQLDPASASRTFTDALSKSIDLSDIELLTPAQREHARTTLSGLLGDGPTSKVITIVKDDDVETDNS